ncbi:MAG: hypothetical protein NTW91_10100, partial [Verrucomicrobia bacterium]|nr:hypothetical protein [Verrucomicrobiota bacterium]
DGKGGDDFLISPFINDGSGASFTAWQNIGGVPTPVTFSGLNTLVGGTGSDTFVVSNGGRFYDPDNRRVEVKDGVVQAKQFDQIIKYGLETPAGQNNLVISAVDVLILSDTDVSQGKFINQAWAAYGGQYVAGNRLDNTLVGYGSNNTLLGAGGRDSISGSGTLIGGTAYGLDSIAGAQADYAKGQTASIYRDTDPVPVTPNGPGSADNSQYWMVNGPFGPVYDPLRNSDTLVGGGVLDGGAGYDSMVGGTGKDTLYVSSINTLDTLTGTGSSNNTSMSLTSGGYGGDVVVGGGVNGKDGFILTGDWIILTGSDVYWSGRVGATTANLGYALSDLGDAAGGQSISNIKLQDGSPVARRATGSATSTGNQQRSNLGEELGSNLLIGNEQDNTLNGGGVGGTAGTGVGVDTLTGGAGADLFVIGTQYSLSNANISATVLPSGSTTTLNVLGTYRTDADYALITDFSLFDTLQLSGSASGYFIGEAPTGFSENNIGGGAPITSASTDFGIYAVTAKGPDLVAQVRGLALGGNLITARVDKGLSVLVGGTPIDGINSTYADPNHLGGDQSSSNDQNALNYLGVGEMYQLQGSDFASRVTFA